MNSMTTLTLGAIENALKDIKLDIAPPPPPATGEELQNPFVQTAATLVSYDPDRILPAFQTPGPEKDKELINQLIGLSELIPITGNPNEAITYRMQDDARKKVLSGLIASDGLKQAVNSSRSSRTTETSRLQEMLTQVLDGMIFNYQELDLEGLNALLKIGEWLSRTPLQIADASLIQNKIVVTELLDTFRHLTGRYENGSFQEYFRGRSAELSVLRQYVGVAETQGAVETIVRLFENYIEPVLNWQSKPPLSIFGIGGAGKSTLLAKFLLDHAEALQQQRFPFVYLDFDRPILDALQPESLLVEAARQLHIQYQDLSVSGSFLDFYNKWKDRRTQGIATTDTESLSISGVTAQTRTRDNRSQIASEFSILMGLFKNFADKPFLLVIDTFEEVQYRGNECVIDLLEYIQELQRLYPLLRVVISGRARIREIKAQELEIKELDPAAVAGYLDRFGIRDKPTINDIIKTVGGNPLSLKLAIELIKQYGKEELGSLKVTQRSLYLFNKRFPDEQVQGILYKRLLGHIRNQQVRRLAHPGLVLRRVSAQLIYHVLNAPCNLNLKDLQAARVLFNELTKEVSLITYVDPDTVRHRPDIRKVMLALIKEDKPKLVEEIHRMAVEFYEKLNDTVSRAEEIYHRLSLDQSFDIIEGRWISGVGQYLGNALDELPSKAQAYLASRLDVPIEETEIWDEENEKINERRIVKRAVNLLNTGHGDKVLDMIGSISQHVNKSGIVTLIKVNAELQLKDIEEARKTIEDAMSRLDISRMQESIKTQLDLIYQKLNAGGYSDLPDNSSDYPEDDADDSGDGGNFNFTM